MSQRKRAKFGRCPTDDDMASKGHYGSILQSIALEKEHDGEALIFAKRAEIHARRLAKKRPLLPTEMLKDVFAFANRFTLDALQAGTRRFDSIVQSMCDVCLRRIDHIWLTHNNFIAVSGEETLSREWTSNDGGVPYGTSEEIAACIRSSYIARFDVHDLRLTNVFCRTVSEQAPHTEIGQLHFRTTDWTDADDHVIALLIDRFASVGRLSFYKCTFSSSQITDDFVRTCLMTGVSDLRVTETTWGFEQRRFSISDDGIMDFCTAPIDGTRMLVADSVPITEQLLRRIVEAAALGRLTDFIMTLKGVDAQLHQNHDYSQFLVSESDFLKLYDFPALNLRVRFTSWDSTMHVRSYGRNPVVGEGSVLNA